MSFTNRQVGPRTMYQTDILSRYFSLIQESFDSAAKFSLPVCTKRQRDSFRLTDRLKEISSKKKPSVVIFANVSSNNYYRKHALYKFSSSYAGNSIIAYRQCTHGGSHVGVLYEDRSEILQVSNKVLYSRASL